MPDAPKRLYVVTRRDIPAGVAAAQLLHAAREFAEREPVIEREWYASSNTIALLMVANGEELRLLVRRAVDRDVSHASFHEPDLGGELTAVAIGPEGSRLVRGYPLFP